METVGSVLLVISIFVAICFLCVGLIYTPAMNIVPYALIVGLPGFGLLALDFILAILRGE